MNDEKLRLQIATQLLAGVLSQERNREELADPSTIDRVLDLADQLIQRDQEWELDRANRTLAAARNRNDISL